MRSEAMKLLRDGAFIPALPLVLNEKRKLDEFRQRRLIRYYLASGADGIAAAVHTTQFSIRSPKHNLLNRVLQIAAEEMQAFERRTGRTVLAVAGVCGKTEQAVQEAKLARSLGFDAVLLSPGGLMELSEEDLLHRTKQVAAEMNVMGFYLQPAVGGRVFSYSYWQALCEIEGVVAVKCAAFDRYLTADVARAIAFSGKPIALYTGNDDHIVLDLLTEYRFQEGEREHVVRCAGGLLGHWAVWTKKAVDIFHAAKRAAENGKPEAELLTLAAQITDANGAFFDTRHRFAGCIAGIHEVLRRQGLMEGIWCLDPQEFLSEGQKEEINRVYAQYPHLNDDAFVADFLRSEKEKQTSGEKEETL